MTALVYGPSLAGGWVLEDARQPVAWSLALSPRRVSSWVSWATQTLFSAGPGPARSVSLALHLVNGVCVALVARRLVPAGAAVLAMGVFLLHPLNTEAVAYPAMQSELLLTGATLAAMLVAPRSLVGAWGLCALAALAKEAGIASFLVVAVWMTSLRALWSWRTAGAWLASVAGPALLAWPVMASLDYGWPEMQDITRSVTGYGALLLKFLIPVGLTPLHDWWGLTRPVAAIGLMVAMLVIGLTWRTRARGGVLLVIASLAPRLPWWLPGGPTEHHVYLASAGMSVAAAALIWRTPERIAS